MKHCRPCTCAAPPVVDLTGAFLQRYHHHHDEQNKRQGNASKHKGETAAAHDGAAGNSSTSTTASRLPPDNDHVKQQQQQQQQQQQIIENQQLYDNLKSCGWSHVCLDLSAFSSHESTTTTSTTNQHHHHHPYQSILENHGQDWKDLLVNLFESSSSSSSHATTNQNHVDGDDDGAVYRVAESGSPDGMVEPKQSWEIKRRCQCPLNHHRHDALNHPNQKHEQQKQQQGEWWLHLERLHAWTDLFHQVACTVRQVLGFPKNILLQEESCCADNNDGQQSRRHDDASCACSLDLLRAFYYETKASIENPSTTTTTMTTTSSSSSTSSIKTVFGSNEHTDWGSFTIVWQDDVQGCLQTYCHACDSWNNVQLPNLHKGGTSASNNSNMVYLVVHVGDITSLAIGRQQQQQQQPATFTTEPVPDTATPSLVQPINEDHSSPAVRTDDNNDEAIGRPIPHQTTTHGDTICTVIWPSPRHRVCLPTEQQQRRASLVYFAYPPPSLSIHCISQALSEWYQTTTSRHRRRHDGSNTPAASYWVPYQDYYLLQNQSAAAAEGATKADKSNDNDNNSAQSQFEKIAAIPLRTVLNEKWNQVQRA